MPRLARVLRTAVTHPAWTAHVIRTYGPPAFEFACGLIVLILAASVAIQAPMDRGAWIVVALLTALATLSLARGVHRLRRAHRSETGVYCQRCGYDLRASTGCCPECGTPTPL